MNTPDINIPEDIRIKAIQFADENIEHEHKRGQHEWLTKYWNYIRNASRNDDTTS